jgi:hypothetical protein
VNAVTCAVPPTAISDAGIAAVSRVAETNVVVRSNPFHRTTEFATKLVPLTVSVNAAPLAVRVVGLILIVVGAGGSLIVKVWGLEVPPPGAGVNTVICAVPATAISEAGIAAVSRVAETNVVVRSDPFHRTTESDTKLVPLTVNVNAAPLAVRVVGLILVVVGTGGSLIVRVWELEMPPPGAGVNTVICAVPATAISDASIAAVSRVAETYVVVRSDPFHRTTELVTKLVPLTVKVNAAPLAVRVVGLILVVVGTGLPAALIVKVCVFEVPPPGAG